ncbi:hypothetical protein LBMAG46_29270 [Planctomycetia bacterium]|nr:hypothetical protein LBMAG46_29270 [Planctomycetia bacterium]
MTFSQISQRQVECSMLSRCPSVLLVWCVFGTVGCITGAARTGAESVLSDGVRPDEPLDPAAVLMVPSELSVGQRVELWRAEGPAAGRAATDTDVEGHPILRYSGTVVRADAGEVALQPAAQLVKVTEVSAVPVLGRVPYVNRAFRQQRVTDQLQPIEGTIVIARSELVAAWDLSAVSEERLMALRPPERIGVDFDVSGREHFAEPRMNTNGHE